MAGQSNSHRIGTNLPSNSVKYTLLTEEDLDLGPALKQGLADARAKVRQLPS
jgi:hypothetical protein